MTFLSKVVLRLGPHNMPRQPARRMFTFDKAFEDRESTNLCLFRDFLCFCEYLTSLGLIFLIAMGNMAFALDVNQIGIRS